jgi:outer membrane protein OmpA-like peptidoglycan-associated protein
VRKTLLAVAVAAGLAAGTSVAQRLPKSDADALAHIFSAFLTQADPGVLSAGVRVGPELQHALALPPGADHIKIYEALVDLAGEKFDVRTATPAEIAAYGARSGLDPRSTLPFYTLEAATRKFLIQYDAQGLNAVYVGQLGVPDPEIRPVLAEVEPLAKAQTAAVGMAAGARKPERQPPVSFSWTGHFDFDQPALATEGREEILAKVKQLAEIRYVIVNGHTDRKGSAEYNQRLSEARAAAVRDHLVANGVDPDRIETFGYGKTAPVQACPGVRERSALIACLAPNRRVVVEIHGVPARPAIEAKTAR